VDDGNTDGDKMVMGTDEVSWRS